MIKDTFAVPPLARSGAKRRGQTLAIALILLGILLVLGLVFLGIVGRGIKAGTNFQNRTLAGDLAEAGIRYAHAQLLNSEKCADWRGVRTPPSGLTDPDYQYLKGPNGAADKGGPDRLGPYFRVNFDNGRALVRVRYAPSDANNFSPTPVGPLRDPARLRNYLSIESVGRPGKVNPNDPTQQAAVGRGEIARRIAFVGLGLIDHSHFITNKYHVSRPAEVGAPTESGLQYQGTQVNIPVTLGTTSILPNLSGSGESTAKLAHGGSFYSNADLKIYGDFRANLNRYLGEGIYVAGGIVGADTNAKLTIYTPNLDGAKQWDNTTTITVLTNPTGLDSGQDNYSTNGGTVRDGADKTDQNGQVRGVKYKTPPSILTKDPDTGENRYVQMTRESGKQGANGNSGIYGHGRGVYVNNTDDRQVPADEQGRMAVGASQSLVYDWLNPNNGQSNSGWVGPYYIPRGAFLELTSDGFFITRDPKSPAALRNWKDTDGNDSGQNTIRYRLGRGTNGQVYILDSLTAPAGVINQTKIDRATFDANGQPFSGVIYFEGNVRVRGVIATNAQITVVSGASIYIEGSVTKGVNENLLVNDDPDPTKMLVNAPTSSMIAFLAKDYVTVNTTQFFGAQGSPQEVQDVPSVVGRNPVRVPAGGASISLAAEFPLNPDSGDIQNPSSWRPYSLDYLTGSTPIDASLLLTHAADDGGPNAFIQMDVNYGVDNPATIYPDDWPYLFDLRTFTDAVTFPRDQDIYNTASAYSPYSTIGYVTPNYGPGTADRAPIYGLGGQSWQRYPKFESRDYPLALASSGAYSTFPNVSGSTDRGTYELFAQSTNELTLRTSAVGADPTNDYLLARSEIAPADVRIEATIFAEEGSFFVIPGAWFNPDPNDRRDTYSGLGATDDERKIARLTDFGSSPMAPFYAEPLDIRIQIVGSVSENMPVPISQQNEWLKKWGWIPGQLGASGYQIPDIHIPSGWNLGTTPYVPNLLISYDPVLATARAAGFMDTVGTTPIVQNPAIRIDADGNVLPPLPRLPVSPTLAYFGEEQP